MSEPEWAEAADRIARTRGGDEAAFADLMRAYYGRLFGAVFRMIPCPEDVEEILQDSFFRFYRSLGRLRPGEDPYPFLRTIAVRRTYSHLRSKRVPTVSLDDLPADLSELSVAGVTISPSALWEWVNQMPPKRRLVFILREMEGYTTGEVAGMMGLMEVTVRRHASIAAAEFRVYFGLLPGREK